MHIGSKFREVKRHAMQVETKTVRVPILIADKIDFKPKTVTRIKEGHYIIIKASIHKENITNVNIYAANIRVPTNIKQILTDVMGEIDNTTVLGDSNTPLSTMDTSYRQKT